MPLPTILLSRASGYFLSQRERRPTRRRSKDDALLAGEWLSGVGCGVARLGMWDMIVNTSLFCFPSAHCVERASRRWVLLSFGQLKFTFARTHLM